MGIFTRFRDIVSSNMNAMLDRAEDPEKMIKLMIREMEDTLVELKVSCAGVIAGRKKVERRLDEVIARERLWAERASLAVRHGKDDLAREALVEKRRFAEMAEALRQEIADHGGLIEQYQSDMLELEDKLAGAKEKRNLLVQRHRRASGKKRAQEEIRRMDSSESMARFEKLESRIEQMEAEADLVNFGRKPTVDDQFADLGRDEEIEKELEKIKAGKYSAENNL
jgi:phage shock protein A